MSRSSKKADDHPVILTPADDVGGDGHLGSGMAQVGTESGPLRLDGQAVWLTQRGLAELYQISVF